MFVVWYVCHFSFWIRTSWRVVSFRSLLAHNRWIHPASGRIYSYSYKAPKVHGKDDITGEDLVQRPDDNPDKVRTRLEAYEEVSNIQKACVGIPQLIVYILIVSTFSFHNNNRWHHLWSIIMIKWEFWNPFMELWVMWFIQTWSNGSPNDFTKWHCFAFTCCVCVCVADYLVQAPSYTQNCCKIVKLDC